MFMKTLLGKIIHVLKNEAIVPNCSTKVKRGSSAFVQGKSKAIGTIEYPFGLYDTPYYPIKLNNFGKKIKAELPGLEVTVESLKKRKDSKKYSKKRKSR